jgi:hypothetical protein
MLNEFHGLLDEGYFVQLRREEGRQEGLEEGLVEGLQEALLMVTELRSRFARCLTRLSLTAQLY